ncbi:flagellar hook protein FlgK [Synergistales bacterium]|nr:flagellar hook protein FlgK [Synergistales bacterium]
MLNSFFGLEMGKRAMNSFRRGIEVAGHNVSNVATEGYSRQRVELSTTEPYTKPGLMRPEMPGQIGTGVKVDQIVRMRDVFLDLQYRTEMTDLGYWEKINSLYNTLQTYISEPSGQGIRAEMDIFWSALNELQKDPESTALRQSVVQSAKSLGSMITNLSSGFDEYASMVNSEVKSMVDQANSILHQVASLNTEISQLQALGQNPNDLLDSRDLLLDKLSKMLDVDYQEPFTNGNITGEYFITLNGRTLVQGNQVRELVAHAFQWDGKVYYDVQVANNEFDITDPNIALALATGPEGIHQLNIDRLANGNEWTIGGQDPFCIEADGTLTVDANGDPIPSRTRPMTTTEALGLASSFRIQVGSQGVLVPSKTFNDILLGTGNILGPGQLGDTYSFRVGVNSYEATITVTWDATANPDANPLNPPHGGWVLSSDTGVPNGLSADTLTGKLSADDLTDFIKTAFTGQGENALVVNTTTSRVTDTSTVPPTVRDVITNFSISSPENHLISISDVSGDLASKMGMANPNPVITIDLDTTDSLETIRNKINEKYQEVYGLTAPEQWVHASLVQDTDQSWYLTIAADVAGEAQRITLMGDASGSNQTLRRLGLVQLEEIGPNATGEMRYREVTAYSKVAVDASFTFDNIRYLSSENTFDKARRVPSGTNRNDYSAKAIEKVSEGMWLELKSVGQTAIKVFHHVKNGEIKALEEIRDGIIPDLQGQLNDIAYSLVKNFNAYQYSGYGIGDNINTTGVAFFDPLGFSWKAAKLLDVNDAVENSVSLIGAATGKTDANGRATSGVSAGAGNGVNASRMGSLKTLRLLSDGSASFGEFYESYLAKIGSEAGRASLMYRTQKNLTDQIDNQRQSIMGVNIDEEMLDILMFNNAWAAMARYVTTIDEMLDTLIHSFGLVGR